MSQWLIVAVVAGIWSAVLPSAFGVNPNLCRNSSFEEGLAGWQFVGSPAGEVSCRVIEGDARRGRKFVRVRGLAAGRASLASADIPVSGGLRYTVSVYVRARGGSG